jgi:hypothetical protein
MFQKRSNRDNINARISQPRRKCVPQIMEMEISNSDRWLAAAGAAWH